MMTKQELDRIYERVNHLRAAYERQPTGGLPPSVQLLREKLTEVADEADVVILSALLQSEYSWLGMTQEEEQLTREMAVRFPDEPAPWISLASFLLTIKGTVAEAKSAIDTAISKAHAKGDFVRHAYQTRARIAKAEKNYPLLEQTLEFLVNFRPAKGSNDVAYEDDFLKNLSPGAVRAELVERYIQLCRKAEE